MLSIHQLLEVLGPHITGQWVRFLPEHSFTQLHVLDGQPVSQPRLLYLGTPDTFILAADRLIRKGCRPTFVLAGSSPALTAYQDREDLNLIATSLSLAALCNLLYEVSADDNLWYQSMSRHLYAQPDLPALLECGAKKLGGYACLLDAGCKLLCASPGPVPPAPLLERLEASTYLSLEDLNALRQTHDVSGQDWVPLEGGEAPWRVRLYSIQYKSQVVAHHLIALPDAACTPAARETASRFQKWVERFVLRYNHDKYESSNALSALLADLIEGRLTESEQLVGRLKQLPVHIKKYFHCIVVEPGSYAGPAHMGQLIRELEGIFPTCVITTYKGDAVILAWKPRHYSEPMYDRDAFQQLLERYDARACIGNFTRWLSSLRSIYPQTKGTLKYARVFCPDPEQRIYRFEDYSMYQIVGLCVDNLKALHGGDPVYLCHPGVITLVAYDSKNGTNLFQVLFTFLKNVRNLTQTARALFFHRNTLQHKIEKIESIIGEDLDSSAIRQRLMFSCTVVEYIQKYLKRDDIYGRKRKTPPTSALVEE